MRCQDDADPAQLNRCRPHQESAACVVTGGASPAIEDDVGDHEEDAIDAHLVKPNDRIKQKVGQRDPDPTANKKSIPRRSFNVIGHESVSRLFLRFIQEVSREGWVSTGLSEPSVNIRVQKNHCDLSAD